MDNADRRGPVDGYAYRQSDDGGTTWDVWIDMAGIDGATTSFVVSGLTNGTTYTFEILASNVGGDSASSNHAMARPLPPLPGPPLNLTPTPGEAQITLNWDAPTTGGPVESYQYRQSTDGGTNWSDWTAADGTNTSYTATPLIPGTEYTFEVRALNLAGGGGSSNQAVATPLEPILRVEFDTTSGISDTIHQGSSVQPSVGIKFSEPVAAFDYNTPSIELTNGYLLNAYENTDTTDATDWILRILPLSDEDVSIAFVAGEACDDGGICTTDGDALLAVPANPYVIEYDARPQIIGGWVTGIPSRGFAYLPGDSMTAIVRFSTEVYVQGGSPTLDIWIEDQLRTADWSGGNGTRELKFTYRMRRYDEETKTPEVAQNGLTLHGSTIRSAKGSDANLAFKLSPYITGVTILPESSGDGKWTNINPAEKIIVEIEFSETVFVDTAGGTPSIGIRPDGFEVRASYSSGSGTDTLTFEYQVAAYDGYIADGNVFGVSIKPESIRLDGGTIVDSSSNSADLTHGGNGNVWRLAPKFAWVNIPLFSFGNEGDDFVEVVLTLREINSFGVHVDYETKDGTAIAGEDYEATSGSLVFLPGETSKTIRVKLLDDVASESLEWFVIDLSDVYWAVLQSDSTGVQISDND